MSFPMVPLFEVVGPTDNPYPGTFCLPQVPLPKGVNVKVGDKATIQVVEAANHGGALYNVRRSSLSPCQRNDLDWEEIRQGGTDL